MADLGDIQIGIKAEFTQLSGLLKTTEQTKRAVKALAKDFARTGDNKQYLSSINKIVRANHALGAGVGMSQAAIMKLGGQIKRDTTFTDRLTLATNKLALAQVASGKAVGNTRNKMNGANMAIQQMGYQFGDFAVQVQGGTSAFVAFSQQGAQLAGILPMIAGPLGLSMGAAVGLSAALGILIPIGSAVGRMFMEMSGGAKTLEDALGDMESSLSDFESSMKELDGYNLDSLNSALSETDALMESLADSSAFLAEKMTFLDAIQSIKKLNQEVGFFSKTWNGIMTMFDDFGVIIDPLERQAKLLESIKSSELKGFGFGSDLDVSKYQELITEIKAGLESEDSLSVIKSIDELVNSALSNGSDVTESGSKVLAQFMQIASVQRSIIDAKTRGDEALAKSQQKTADFMKQEILSLRGSKALRDIELKFGKDSVEYQREINKQVISRYETGLKLKGLNDKQVATFVKARQAGLEGEIVLKRELGIKKAKADQDKLDRKEELKRLKEQGKSFKARQKQVKLDRLTAQKEEIARQEALAKKTRDLHISVVQNRIDGVTAYYAYEEQMAKKKADRDKLVAEIQKKERLRLVDLGVKASGTQGRGGAIAPTEGQVAEMGLGVQDTGLEARLKGAARLNDLRDKSLAKMRLQTQEQLVIQGLDGRELLVAKQFNETYRKQLELSGLQLKDTDAQYITEVELLATKQQSILAAYDLAKAEEVAREASIVAAKELDKVRQKQEALGDFIGNSFEKSMMSIVDGTLSVKDAFKVMVVDIVKELYRVLVVQRMIQAAKGAMGIPFADGGVISSGSQVQAYANGGVVGGPTTFPMSGGRTGLMGEAGPEAIMPLKRGANGKLGVQMEGGGNSGGDTTTVVQNFNISSNTSEETRSLVVDTIRQATPELNRSAEAHIVNSRKRGGYMKATFG